MTRRRSSPRSPRRLAAALALASGLVVAPPPPAAADTFEEALSAAYLANPRLQAERARQRATDEGVPRALGGFRPTITLSGEAGRAAEELRSRSALTGATSEADQGRSPHLGQIQFRQPIYDGGRTFAEVERSEMAVLQGRARLESIEQSVLSEAARVYLDLVREYEILRLTSDNVAKLEDLLQATRARFRVKDVTQADVAQSEARLARGIADRKLAEGNLARTLSAYVRVVGAQPNGAVVPPGLPSGLPATLEQALTASEDNPDLRAARFAERAAVAQVDVARSGLRPDLALRAAVRRQDETDQPGLARDTAEAVVQLTIPLYQGGVPQAQTREAKHVANQRLLELDQTRREVLDGVRAAWEGMMTARSRIASIERQVAAARMALESVVEEVRVGARSVLDRLNAEQELLEANVSLARAKRDHALAAFDVLAATGRMTAASLNLSAPRYDPSEHYEATRGRWFGTGIDPITSESGVKQ